jgi:hypothetical protein
MGLSFSYLVIPVIIAVAVAVLLGVLKVENANKKLKEKEGGYDETAAV